uniref:EF-hand domain-containing protein n=1 Tax=Oryza meridionalis TaxID=40149 RepID=A0A0E0CKQ8_9ORYZ
MIGEVDQDNDGRIDYNEFVAMMQKTTTGFGKKGGMDGEQKLYYRPLTTWKPRHKAGKYC